VPRGLGVSRGNDDPRGDSLLLVEHRLSTRTHATVNAALLLALRRAMAGVRIVFASDPRHADFVEEVLRVHGEGFRESGVAFCAIPAPRPRPVAGRARFLIDRVRTLQTVGRVIRETEPGGVVYCSAAGTDSLFLGRFLGRSIPTLVVVHELNRLVPSSAGARLLRYALKAARTTSLRFVVLGPSILAGLQRVDPALASRFCAVPVPCLHPRLSRQGPDRGLEGCRDAAAGESSAARRPVRFGRMGGDGRGGAGTFLEVARAVQKRTPAARFVMVGSTGLGRSTTASQVEIEGYSETPLSYAEYCRRAASIDYAVWVGDAAQYQLTASASVVDAVAFAKPLVTLRNPFTEWLFDTFGDIGCLCSDSAEMVEAIVSRAEQGISTEYLEEVAHVRRAQQFFSLERTGHLLRDHLEQLGRPSRVKTLREP